jgi:ribosomal protein S18 acetylase RimI-like enzyme
VPAALAIRRYRPADAGRVRELDTVTMDATDAFGNSVPTVEPDRIPAEYAEAGGNFLVGEIAGRIVAMGAFRPAAGYMTDLVDEPADTTAEIKWLRIAPAHQRRGHGGALCATLEARARKRGFADVVLDTNPEQRGARRLYAKRGFEEVGHERVETDSDSFETVVYRKSLAENQ